VLSSPSIASDASELLSEALTDHCERSIANSPSGDIQSSKVSHPPRFVPRSVTMSPVPDRLRRNLPSAFRKSADVIAARALPGSIQAKPGTSSARASANRVSRLNVLLIHRFLHPEKKYRTTFSIRDRSSRS